MIIYYREIDAKKTPRGKERFIKAQKDGLRFIDRNRRHYILQLQVI